jgi:antitoxin ParD1/3/4
MTTNVHLTSDLEDFARDCVKSGRYNNVSEVLRSALRMLQESEEQRKAFMAMLRAARNEADRKGVHTVQSVAEEMDAIIAASS